MTEMKKPRENGAFLCEKTGLLRRDITPRESVQADLPKFANSD